MKSFCRKSVMVLKNISLRSCENAPIHLMFGMLYEIARQCTYNVTLRHIRTTVVAEEN